MPTDADAIGLGDAEVDQQIDGRFPSGYELFDVRVVRLVTPDDRNRGAIQNGVTLREEEQVRVPT